MPSATTANFPFPRVRSLVGRISWPIPSISAWVKLIHDALGPSPAGTQPNLGLVYTPWQHFWGESYGPDLKRWLLKPVFEGLEREGKLGDLIMDVGSGAAHVTQMVPPKAGRKWILVDIAGDNARSAAEQRIRLDAEKIAHSDALSFRKSLLRICGFLGMDPRTKADSQCVDTIVFSDVLNYVDFEKVLVGFAAYLKPGGRMIVNNLPMRGNQSLFSDKGLKDNRDLYRVLLERGFEIESKSFPKRDPKETEESEELIILLARKQRA